MATSPNQANQFDDSAGCQIVPNRLLVLQKTESQSGNMPERAMKKTLSSRGNKTTLLFKQLPDIPTET